MGAYRAAASRFVAKQSGPVGDTKYDIFDKSGMTRAQMKRARTGQPKAKPRPAPRYYRSPSSGFVPGETI